MRFRRVFAKASAIGAMLSGLLPVSHADDMTLTFRGTIDPMFGIAGNYHYGLMTECGYKHISEMCNGQPAVGRPYGAWFDGPINPYKYGSETYFQIAHSQNYRIKVTGNNWGTRHLWTIEPNNTVHGATITPADSDVEQSHYQMRNWIYSPYVQYPNIYGLTHHEWYSSITTVNGIPFLSDGHTTVWGLGWISSADGGNTWAMNPINYSAPSNANRMVMIPEPWNPSLPKFYGFSHPSNIVKEGNYYYAFTTNASQKANGQLALGVSLIRTSNLASSSGWQYWNGSGWTTVSQGTYQGNGGPQQPYIFWESTGACSHLYAHNVRKHAASGKWIVLGADYCAGKDENGNITGKAVYTWIDSLANPVTLDKTANNQPRPPKVIPPVGNYIPFNAYYSFFDESGSPNVGDNFEVVNNSALFTAINAERNTIFHQYVDIVYTP